jgi:phosphopantetheine adenylyltransferase
MRVVFTCGRFNPVTIGHARMVEEMQSIAGNGAVRIFATGTHDRRRNPLPPEIKVGFLERAFPDVLVGRALHAFDAIAQMAVEGIREAVFVTGEDRAELAGNVTRYAADLGMESISTHLVGRTPEAPSATMARAAAEQNDFTAFRSLVPQGLASDPDLASDIFRAVRLGLGV